MVRKCPALATGLCGAAPALAQTPGVSAGDVVLRVRASAVGTALGRVDVGST